MRFQSVLTACVILAGSFFSLTAHAELPELLSATGLYEDIATKQIASDVVAYDVEFPLASRLAVAMAGIE